MRDKFDNVFYYCLPRKGRNFLRNIQLSSWKIVNVSSRYSCWKVDNSTWLTLLTRHEGPQTRLSSDPLSLETKPARLDLRKHFFSVRIPTIWNALPLTIRQSTSVNQFKALYDKFQKNQSAWKKKKKWKIVTTSDFAYRAKCWQLSSFGTGGIVSV